MRSLVLLSCSARKRKTPTRPIPAIQRYDGVLFRVLRKYIREQGRSPKIDILVLSARYGLITSQAPIRYYDQRMTRERASELQQAVQTALIRSLGHKRYARILVAVGYDYRPLLHATPCLRHAFWQTGPIGKRAQFLKSWLHNSHSVPLRG